MSRHAQVGLQMIMERRARDDSLRACREADRVDAGIRARADFESRSLNRYQAGELKRRAHVHSQQSEEQIDERRRKLYDLLNQDEQQYAQEISASVESPMQRRLRLMDSLKTLQDVRQQEHDEYVAQKREQGWRDSCDPLRHQISEALLRQVIAERDAQVIAKDLERMEGDATEAQYADTVRQNLREFREQQEQEREERQMKIRRNREVWLGEMATHQRRAAGQKQADYEESLQFRNTTEQAIEQARLAAEEKARQQAARRQELDTLNAEQIAYKQAQIDAERELDLRHAGQAAEDLRQEQEEEMVKRLVRVRKQGQTATLRSTQLGRIHAANEEADEYIQQAQEECNRKEDELRARDAAARRKLMMDSVAHRVATIQLHDDQRQQRRIDKEKEKQELEEDLQMKRQLDEEERDTRRRLIDNQSQMLASQCALKHELEEKARTEERESVRQLIQGWNDEETRIQEELAHPHALVGGRFRGHR